MQIKWQVWVAADIGEDERLYGKFMKYWKQLNCVQLNYAQPIPLTHFDTLNLILEFDETVENQFGQQSVSAMKQDKPWKGEYET